MTLRAIATLYQLLRQFANSTSDAIKALKKLHFLQMPYFEHLHGLHAERYDVV